MPSVRQIRHFALILSLGFGGLEVQAQATRQQPNQRPGEVCVPQSASHERWRRYLSRLPKAPDTKLAMPVKGVRVRQVRDTFGAPRSGGRRHEGQDILAPRGTPIYSATSGFVVRMGYDQLGGLFVYVVGAGGRRYYYAHLDRFATGLEAGQQVTTRTRLGYVGNTGNARATVPHLHFGVFSGSRRTCDRRVIDPLPLLVDRDWQPTLTPARNR